MLYFEVRKKDPDFVKGHHQTFFNDGYPFLLTSQIITPAENEIQFYSFGESSLSICHFWLSGITGWTKQPYKGANTHESFQTQVLNFQRVLIYCNYLIS